MQILAPVLLGLCALAPAVSGEEHHKKHHKKPFFHWARWGHFKLGFQAYDTDCVASERMGAHEVTIRADGNLCKTFHGDDFGAFTYHWKGHWFNVDEYSTDWGHCYMVLFPEVKCQGEPLDVVDHVEAPENMHKCVKNLGEEHDKATHRAKSVRINCSKEG